MMVDCKSVFKVWGNSLCVTYSTYYLSGNSLILHVRTVPEQVCLKFFCSLDIPNLFQLACEVSTVYGFMYFKN